MLIIPVICFDVSCSIWMCQLIRFLYFFKFKTFPFDLSCGAQSSKTTTNFNNSASSQDEYHLTINSYQIDLERCIDLQDRGKMCPVPLTAWFCLDMTLQWLGTEVTLRTCTDCLTLDTGSYRTTIPNPSSYSYFL